MIVVRIWEGLGNQMFQYAYARALQENTDNRVFLEGRRIYRKSLPGEDMSIERKCGIHHFRLALKFIKPERLAGWDYLRQETLAEKMKYFLSQKGIGNHLFQQEVDMYTYQEELLELWKNTYVMGHFFHRDYYESIREILLKEFTLKKEMMLPQELERALEQRETISVHIRRGDYLYIECVQALNREMEKGGYYRRAMEYMEKRIEKPLFLIFSDDIEWVEQNFPCSCEHLYVSGMGFQDYEELMLMARCKHNIIANSTFSFWGGWLNRNADKMVIAPKHWMPSVIPKGWILM